MRWKQLSTVLVLGLLVAGMVPAVAGTGDPVVNGEMNWARRTTVLRSSGAIAYRVQSNKGAALELRSAAGQPPMVVDSSVVVTDLNADLLDGRSADDLIPKTQWCSNDALPAGQDWSCTFMFQVPAGGATLLVNGSYDIANTGGGGLDVGCWFDIQMPMQSFTALTDTVRSETVGPGEYTTCASTGARGLAAGYYGARFTAAGTTAAGLVPQHGAAWIMVVPN